MTAPLEQLRDTRRKDSSTALKPMTATGELDEFSALNSVWERTLGGVTLDPRLFSQSWSFSELFKEGSLTLSLSLSTCDPPTQRSPPPLPRLPPHAWNLPTPSLPVCSDASSSYSPRWRLIEDHCGSFPVAQGLLYILSTLRLSLFPWHK